MAFGKLWQHFLVMHDWSSDELGEKRHKQSIIERVFLDGFTAEGIDQIGDLLESKKGNRQRQHHIGQGNG